MLNGDLRGPSYATAGTSFPPSVNGTAASSSASPSLHT
jgi:hypothetical protein